MQTDGDTRPFLIKKLSPAGQKKLSPRQDPRNLPMLPSLEVITGPMFSSKSTMLVNRVRLHRRRKDIVCLLKHSLDTRSGEKAVVATHDGLHEECLPCSRLAPSLVPANATLVAIDEVQFFDTKEAVEFVRTQLSLNRDVVVAGLDMDRNCMPWPTTAALLCLATRVEKLFTNCGVYGCRHPARYTARTVASLDEVLIGGVDSYVAACAYHHGELTCKIESPRLDASPLRRRPVVNNRPDV